MIIYVYIYTSIHIECYRNTYNKYTSLRVFIKHLAQHRLRLVFFAFAGWQLCGGTAVRSDSAECADAEHGIVIDTIW